MGDVFERWREEYPFPDPSRADSNGLLAYGGDLSPGRLVSAYASGVFPWYESDPILWFSPDPRWVLEPSQLHVGRNVRRVLRRGRYTTRLDTAFPEVIRYCASVPRKGQAGTWITPEMQSAYCELHRQGLAHSAEVWEAGELVGGLYGVSLGTAFFGESMFSLRPDASKLALVALVQQLAVWDFELVDCQVHTEHLERFGAAPWSRSHFLERLAPALREPTRVGVWCYSDEISRDANS